MTKKYRPVRDYRFEYLMDAINFVEENQCKGCAFRKDGEYPMCSAVESRIIAESGPVQALDDLGDEGIVCVEFRDQELAEQEHPDQLRLL